MFKKVISLAILVSISAAFSGCGTPLAPDQIIGTPTGQNLVKPIVPGQPMDQTASVVIKDGESAETAEVPGTPQTVATTYSEKDSTAFEEAVESKDSTKCDAIEDAEYKLLCKTTVDSEMETEKDNTEAEEQIEKDAELAAQLTESGEYQRCKEIEDENQAFYCEVQVLTNKAINDQDNTVCNLASSEDIKAKCLEDYVTMENTAEAQQ